MKKNNKKKKRNKMKQDVYKHNSNEHKQYVLLWTMKKQMHIFNFIEKYMKKKIIKRRKQRNSFVCICMCVHRGKDLHWAKICEEIRKTFHIIIYLYYNSDSYDEKLEAELESYWKRNGTWIVKIKRDKMTWNKVAFQVKLKIRKKINSKSKDNPGTLNFLRIFCFLPLKWSINLDYFNFEFQCEYVQEKSIWQSIKK